MSTLARQLHLIFTSNSLLKKLEKHFSEIRKIGIKVGGEIISFFRFADDIALLANNEHDLERSLEEVARCFQKYQLISNWRKSKVMMCQKSDRIRRINIQTGNQLLEQVEHFKYLGSLTNQDGRCVMERIMDPESHRQSQHL